MHKQGLFAGIEGWLLSITLLSKLLSATQKTDDDDQKNLAYKSTNYSAVLFLKLPALFIPCPIFREISRSIAFDNFGQCTARGAGNQRRGGNIQTHGPFTHNFMALALLAPASLSFVKITHQAIFY